MTAVPPLMPGPAPGTVLEALVIGAGFGGIRMAVALRRAGIDDFLVLEKGSDLGAVWRDNTSHDCVRRFSLASHIRHGAETAGARFDEACALWEVHLAGVDCRFELHRGRWHVFHLQAFYSGSAANAIGALAQFARERVRQGTGAAAAPH